MLLSAVEAARTGRPSRARSEGVWRDRTACGAIVFVLFTGTAWKQIPRELGCSGSTAHDRLTAWAKAGVFDSLHAELLRRLKAAGKIDWAAGIIDGSHIQALKRADLTGPSQ